MKKLADNILCWCKNPSEQVIEQAKNISKHPYLVGNVCILPNAYEGVFVPMGCVVALKDAICPNMVGADVGCGITLVRTSARLKDADQLKLLIGKIKTNVPFYNYEYRYKSKKALLGRENLFVEKEGACKNQIRVMRRQFGTLGGTGHFIEIQKDEKDFMWYMIHHNISSYAAEINKYYEDIANQSCTLNKQEDLVQNGLSVLLKGTKEYDDYIEEMNTCTYISRESRKIISDFISKAFRSIFSSHMHFYKNYDILHSYAQLEQHYGTEVWVHRKGAISVDKGEIGVVPGSAGTASYIGIGTGSLESMHSCAHGAGRAMSPRQAKTTLTLESEQKKIDDLNVLFNLNAIADLEGAPGAFKDIETVMDEQNDLIVRSQKLIPLAVIKY